MLTCAAHVDSTVCTGKKTCITLVFLCFCFFKLKCNYCHIQQVSNDRNSNIFIIMAEAKSKQGLRKDMSLLSIKSDPVNVLNCYNTAQELLLLGLFHSTGIFKITFRQRKENRVDRRIYTS